jgi:hypothetical protein
MRAEMASGIGYLEAYNCHVGGVTGLPAQSNIYTRKPVDAAKTNALKTKLSGAYGVLSASGQHLSCFRRRFT